MLVRGQGVGLAVEVAQQAELRVEGQVDGSLEEEAFLDANQGAYRVGSLVGVARLVATACLDANQVAIRLEDQVDGNLVEEAFLDANQGADRVVVLVGGNLEAMAFQDANQVAYRVEYRVVLHLEVEHQQAIRLELVMARLVVARLAQRQQERVLVLEQVLLSSVQLVVLALLEQR